MFEASLVLPEHDEWSFERIDSVCSIVSRGTAPAYVGESQVRAIGQRCVMDYGFDSAPSRPHDHRKMSNVLEPAVGDVLLNSTGTGTIGRSCVFDGSGRFIIDGHVTLLRPHSSVDPRWINALLRHPKGQRVLETTCYAGSTNQVELSRTKLLSAALPVPPLPEQRRIAEILDTLDEAILATEQVIAKLQQMKQGLLHDLLTRGIDEHGELRPPPEEAPGLYKDSPLGRIPKTWGSIELGEIVDPRRPIVYGILMPGQGHPGGVPVVKVKDIFDDRIDTADLLLTSPAIDEEYRRSRLKAGDLLFTIRGTVGRMAFVPPNMEGANITQDTARVSIASRAVPAFVRECIRMPVPQGFIDTHTIGQAVKGINLRELRRLPLVLPPADEQGELASLLGYWDRRIHLEKEEAEKLRTLKHGLMDDLLTGRVRTLPTEATA